MRHALLPCLLCSLIAVVAPGADQDPPSGPVKNPLPAPLTPAPPPTPRINGAQVLGVRPGSPLLFTIAATGDRPMTFGATGLPAGVTLDAATGRLSGVLPTPGVHDLTLTARNARGSQDRRFRIVVGEELALTPPMGWNSWYCQSEGVNQAAIIAMAEAMVASGLVNHGWTYINLDDCWQGTRQAPDYALWANEKFPDMQGMCARIHALGLKVGLYSTPWIGSYAGFRGGSSLSPTGEDHPRVLPLDQRLQPNQVFGRYPGFTKAGANTVGPHWFCDADARQWAAWGVDYVKYDWHPIDVATTRRLAAGLRTCGRDIILSLSNAAQLPQAGELSGSAQLWRTTGDIHESWESIHRIGFDQDPWAGFCRPGHWNDPDMLQIGMLGTPNKADTAFHPSKLTADEQYTQVSLWCLMAAPLILSCDLTQLDAFTLGLITNDEVLAIDQDPLGHQGTTLTVNADVKANTTVVVKRLAGGACALGLFNRGDAPAEVSCALSSLPVQVPVRVRDLWRQVDRPQSGDTITATVAPHGVVLLRVGN